MNIRFCTLAALMFLISVCTTLHARGSDSASPVMSPSQQQTRQETPRWWGYFDGSFNEVTSQGLGSSMPYPLTYNSAIKISAADTGMQGRVIEAVKFGFFRTDYIEDVRVWLSTTLPTASDFADIVCQPVDISSFADTGEGHCLAEVPLAEPYLFGSTDIYVGYSFTVTSDEGDLNTYPLMLSSSTTSENAFFFNWGMTWQDYSGEEYGNLALMLRINDDSAPVRGDVNYDRMTDVGDLSAITEYLARGSASPFNVKAADIDGNGSVDKADASALLEMILGKNAAASGTK